MRREGEEAKQGHQKRAEEGSRGGCCAAGCTGAPGSPTEVQKGTREAGFGDVKLRRLA